MNEPAPVSLGVDMARLAGSTVLDEAGNVHSTASLWSEQLAVLVFLRHFG